MPIFEFRCCECGHLYEKIFVSSDEKVDIECPECECGAFERVLSATNYAIGAGPGGNKPKVTTKSCSPGNSCTTIDIPGPAK